MRTFLITYYTGKCSNGYAVVTALNATLAKYILRSQGIKSKEGYRIVTTKDLLSPCEGLTIVTEGIVSLGLSAYQIAVKYGYLGTEEQWAKSLLSGGTNYGTIAVDTIAELSDISAVEGLRAFVKETNCDYQYRYKNGNLTWLKDEGGSSSTISIGDNGDWYINGEDTGISTSQSIYIGETAPTTLSDKLIWVDTSNDDMLDSLTESSLRASISYLQQLVAKLMNIVNYGAIAGDSTTSANTIISSSTTPIDPNTDEEDSETRPTSGITYTVPHLAVKKDTLANFKKNSSNLIDGEIIIITDASSSGPGLYGWINNKFVRFTTTGSSIDGDDTDTDDMTQSDIEAMYFSSLGFKDSNDNTYSVSVNSDGILQLYNNANYDNDQATAKALLGKLFITKVFCGGEGTTIDSFVAATHNFVELGNISTSDINLNGLYLCYYNPNTATWAKLALKGIIKAGSTFLIRGKLCGVKINTAISVDKYDMLWDDSSDLIEFGNQGGTFYLTYSKLDSSLGRVLYDANNAAWIAVDSFAPTTLFTATLPDGYIDLVGIKSSKDVYSEGSSPLTIKTSENITDCIFFRFNGLDVTTNTITAYAKRKSSTSWCYCNITDKATLSQPYFDDIHLLTPRASSENSTFYGTRTTFDSTKPNFLNCTFGKQATVTSSKGADRCFTWVSVGYYNEYLQYKSSTDSSWTTIESITADNVSTVYNNDSTISTFIDVYKRKKWVTSNQTAVTTHRVILRNLAAGTYTYRVYRDDSYISDELQFTVKADSAITSFKYVQTTDQQGWTYMEYLAWRKSCYAISQALTDVDFMINTGDMTQSGNRESEWLDYYNGRKSMWNVVEMPTIGNNDLGPINTYDLATLSTNKVCGKYFQYLYTFDLDTSNSAYFIYKQDGAIDTSLLGDVITYGANQFTYYMPSMYSFNYGDYHFICLNSEFYTFTDSSLAVYSIYYNDSNISGTFKTSAYYQQYKWLKNDIAANSGKKIVVFTHELPFNITAVLSKTNNYNASLRTLDSGKSYSELNTDFTSGIVYAGDTADSNTYAGGFSYSLLFQEKNVKLVMGGHKHTYSLSYPIKETFTTDSTGKRTLYPNYPLKSGETLYSDGTNYQIAASTPSGYTAIVSASSISGSFVTYAMCQATGYKLQSNNDMPGYGINWLRYYYPCTQSNSVPVLNSGQLYPMYTVCNCSTGITLNSYIVTGVYDHTNDQSVKTFDVNNLSDVASQVISDIQNTEITY